LLAKLGFFQAAQEFRDQVYEKFPLFPRATKAIIPLAMRYQTDVIGGSGDNLASLGVLVQSACTSSDAVFKEFVSMVGAHKAKRFSKCVLLDHLTFLKESFENEDGFCSVGKLAIAEIQARAAKLSDGIKAALKKIGYSIAKVVTLGISDFVFETLSALADVTEIIMRAKELATDMTADMINSELPEVKRLHRALILYNTQEFRLTVMTDCIADRAKDAQSTHSRLAALEVVQLRQSMPPTARAST